MQRQPPTADMQRHLTLKPTADMPFHDSNTPAPVYDFVLITCSLPMEVASPFHLAIIWVNSFYDSSNTILEDFITIKKIIDLE